MAPPTQTIEFHYDISCPFAYIASTKIEALATRTNATIHWRPVLLGAIYRLTAAPQGAAGSASDVFNPTKKAVTGLAFKRTIRRLGLEYAEPPRHPVKTTRALRLLYYVPAEQRATVSKALFRAYWIRGEDVTQTSTLVAAVRASGVPDADALVKVVEDDAFDNPSTRQELESTTNLAVERGTPGVPAFWLPHETWLDPSGQQRQGRLYWGQDRMHFLEAVLLAQGNGKALSAVGTPLRSLEPRCVRRAIPPSGEEVRVEFWYDFSSPWAFLGWTQLARLAREFGGRMEVVMKPFLLGILFREIGAPNLPMAAISEQKRQYSRLDHNDWVRWWNEVNRQEGKPDKHIEFHWADKFPIRTPTALRAVIVEPKLVGPLFRGCWEQNLDMGDDAVLSRVIDSAGYSGAEILKRANEPDIKAELRERTKEAKETGINGVPSYRVFRKKMGQDESAYRQVGDIVWGQDLINDVEDYIAGWDGKSVAKVGSNNRGIVSARL